MKKTKFSFSRKFSSFPCGCWSLKSFINCKHILVAFYWDSIFPAEINTLEQDLPDLRVPLSCSFVYCHLNDCVIRSHVLKFRSHWHFLKNVDQRGLPPNSQLPLSFQPSAVTERQNHFVRSKGKGSLSLKEASAFERLELSEIAIVYIGVKVLKTSFSLKIKFEISFRRGMVRQPRDKRLAERVKKDLFWLQMRDLRVRGNSSLQGATSLPFKQFPNIWRGQESGGD